MGPGLLGAPGALAQAPAMVDPTCLWKDEAARVLHLSPPRSPLGSRAQSQPMSSEPAVACHPAQVHRDKASDALLLIWAQMLCHFMG